MTANLGGKYLIKFCLKMSALQENLSKEGKHFLEIEWTGTHDNAHA